MPRLTIDATLPQKLLALAHPAELCDESGRVVGQFTPAIDSGSLEPQISEEELRRREQAGGGRKLSEILADLSKRP